MSVPAGTQLAVDLQSAVTLRGSGRARGLEGSTIYTAADRISAAQRALAQQNYYRGPISGQLDDATRRALFQFQVDRGLSATGNLDGRTAQALGINVGAGVPGSTSSGSILSAAQASAVRRDAQNLVSRYRSELSASGVGRSGFDARVRAGRSGSMVCSVGVRGQRIDLRTDRCQRQQSQWSGASGSRTGERRASGRQRNTECAFFVAAAERVEYAPSSAQYGRYFLLSFQRGSLTSLRQRARRFIRARCSHQVLDRRWCSTCESLQHSRFLRSISTQHNY